MRVNEITSTVNTATVNIATIVYVNKYVSNVETRREPPTAMHMFCGVCFAPQMSMLEFTKKKLLIALPKIENKPDNSGKGEYQ